MQTDPEEEAAVSGCYKMNSGSVTEQENLTSFPVPWNKPDPSVFTGRRKGVFGS